MFPSLLARARRGLREPRTSRKYAAAVAVRMICNRDDPTTTNRKNASSTGPTRKGDCFFSERGAGRHRQQMRRGGQLAKSPGRAAPPARARPNRPRSSRRGPYQRARRRCSRAPPRALDKFAAAVVLRGHAALDLSRRAFRWHAAAGASRRRVSTAAPGRAAHARGCSATRWPRPRPPGSPVGAPAQFAAPAAALGALTLPNTHSITDTRTEGEMGKGDARAGGGGCHAVACRGGGRPPRARSGARAAAAAPSAARRRQSQGRPAAAGAQAAAPPLRATPRNAEIRARAPRRLSQTRRRGARGPRHQRQAGKKKRRGVEGAGKPGDSDGAGPVSVRAPAIGSRSARPAAGGGGGRRGAAGAPPAPAALGGGARRGRGRPEDWRARGREEGEGRRARRGGCVRRGAAAIAIAAGAARGRRRADAAHIILKAIVESSAVQGMNMTVALTATTRCRVRRLRRRQQWRGVCVRLSVTAAMLLRAGRAVLPRHGSAAGGRGAQSADASLCPRLGVCLCGKAQVSISDTTWSRLLSSSGPAAATVDRSRARLHAHVCAEAQARGRA